MTLDLLEWKPTADDAPTEKPTNIELRFAAFIREHPGVYRTMRDLALDAVRAGRKKIGISELWEVSRWQLHTQAQEGGYSLNNDFRACMARLLMQLEPELNGVFETRTRRAK